jgi:DNA-nicking Smr family endonuclease
VRRPGRKLTKDEAALWDKVARTVVPLDPARNDAKDPGPAAELEEPRVPARRPASSPPQPSASPTPRALGERKPAPATFDRHGLDAGWDRRLSRGLVPPDFTLDLHGSTLDAAHSRLDHGLTLALQQGARVVLLITGRHRPSDDRSSRGVIRRKFMDWLASGSHASRIAAIRSAHPRHGGAGAVYIVLRRPR